MKSKLYTTLAFLLLLLTCQQVQAKAIFEAGVGVFGISLPDYPGAKEQTAYVLPFPYFYYKDDRITVDREGLVGSLLQGDKWEIDASFSAGIPVRSDEAEIREGMPDLDWTLEAGPRLLYYLSGSDNSNRYVRTQLFARKALATDATYLHQVGYRAGGGVEFRQKLNLNDREWIFTSRATAYWANGEFLDYYYGVPDNLATDVRPAYSNHSGYAGSEVSVGLTVRFKKVWLGGFTRYQNFSGAQQSGSALMQTTSSWTVGLGAVWIIKSNRD